MGVLGYNIYGRYSTVVYRVLSDVSQNDSIIGFTPYSSILLIDGDDDGGGGGGFVFFFCLWAGFGLTTSSRSGIAADEDALVS